MAEVWEHFTGPFSASSHFLCELRGLHRAGTSCLDAVAGRDPPACLWCCRCRTEEGAAGLLEELGVWSRGTPAQSLGLRLGRDLALRWTPCLFSRYSPQNELISYNNLLPLLRKHKQAVMGQGILTLLPNFKVAAGETSVLF